MGASCRCCCHPVRCLSAALKHYAKGVLSAKYRLNLWQMSHPAGAAPQRRGSGQASAALSRSAWAQRGLGSTPDATSHLQYCVPSPWLARDFRTRIPVDRHLSVFLPYDRPPHHEDQLTRAAMIVMRTTPLARVAGPGGCAAFCEAARG